MISLNLFIMNPIQMQKHQKTILHRRHPSADYTKDESRNNSKKKPNLQSDYSHLVDFKEKGLKVLKKLIPNQPINKLKKLVQLGADNIKKQILLGYYPLLPKLTTTEIISELVQQPDAGKFQEMNRELTNSMLFFQKQVHPNLENTQMGEIVRVQTDKCYSHIPKQYFETEFNSDALNGLLSRDKDKIVALRDDLGDFYDEVEFNVNQQVNYKMRIFMNFVSYLASIGIMADLSIKKIQGTRAKNMIIKEIVIQRAHRVNLLRGKKEEIQKSIKVLDKLKKLKRLQDWFMSQVQAKGKITALSLYPEYCSIHAELKSYCCSKLLCKYWDVTYYIQRGYQDSFCRSLKNYLGQIIVLDEKQLHEIVTPNKNLFATVQDYKHINSLSDPGLKLDESFQVDEEEVELISKHNIEREIVSNFKQGLFKCSYSTDDICQEIKNVLLECEKKMYLIARGENKISQEVVQLTAGDRKQALEKLTTMKYVRVVEQWSERMKKVIKRQFSIIERALKASFELQLDHPEKYEIICSYLMQIIYITFGVIDESMTKLITCRKFKQQESDHIKQVLLYEQQWEELISDTKHSAQIWKQFQLHFIGEEIQEEEKEKYHSLIQGLLPTLTAERLKMLEVMINGYNCSSLQKMAASLREEEWKTASIPSRFYRIIGQVLYGPPFKEDLDRLQVKMLSSSLLLDKNSSSFMGQSQTQFDFKQQTPIITSDQIPSTYRIHMSQTVITIQQQKYRILSSTIQIIQNIQGYLEWVEQSSQNEKLENNILTKIMEFFITYNSHIKDLILNKTALNHGKIKSKSITGKHLLIAYSQLKLARVIVAMIGKRCPKFSQFAHHVKEKLDKNMADVSKKFRLVLQLSIRESINKLVVDPRREITWPVPESTEIVTALHRSCDYIRDILMSDQQLSQFITVQWCALYLQKIKAQYKSVYKQIMNSNGTKKSKDIDWSDNIYWKYKELEYIVQNLSEFKDCLPGFNTIIEELEQEKKKVENSH